MTKQHNDTAPSEISAITALDEQAVAGYLRSHPDFFRDKAALLADMRIPHDVGGAVSLVERQIAALRDANQRQKKQLDNLIDIARENDRLNNQLHSLILGMVACGNLGDVIELVYQRLQKDFAADQVVLCLLAQPLNENYASRSEIVGEPQAFRQQFHHLLSANKPYCGRLKSQQLEALFSPHADNVGSVVLLPLGDKGAIGILAICSYDEQRFQPGADTAFLVRMSEVIGAVFTPYFKLPG